MRSPFPIFLRGTTWCFDGVIAFVITFLFFSASLSPPFPLSAVMQLVLTSLASSSLSTDQMVPFYSSCRMSLSLLLRTVETSVRNTGMIGPFMPDRPFACVDLLKKGIKRAQTDREKDESTRNRLHIL